MFIRSDEMTAVLQQVSSLATGTDPDLTALRLAILVEDVFGILLTDDEIDLSVLASPDRLRELVNARSGPT